MISPSSSYFAKNNLLTPIKYDNKKLIIGKSIIKQKENIKTPLSQIYRKKILYEKLKTPINKTSFLNQSQKLLFKKKRISLINSQSQNNSLIMKHIKNSNSVNYDRNYDKTYKSNNKVQIEGNNKINLNKTNFNYTLSPWRSMSIGFNEFSLSTKRINYSYIPESQENFRKIILIQSFFRRYIIRRNIYRQLIKYYYHNSATLKLINIIVNSLKNIFCEVIENIYLSRNHKYYLNIKEYELLVELHKRNIFNKKDWINYFNKLINGTLIRENKNEKK
jgi:hypothetical protein